MFIRKGWDIYNSDAVERGRSGFAPPDVWKGEPNFLPTKANPFERFRIEQGPLLERHRQAKVIPGNQFPVEGYDKFHQADRAALDQHRRGRHCRLHRAGR